MISGSDLCNIYLPLCTLFNTYKTNRKEISIFIRHIFLLIVYTEFFTGVLTYFLNIIPSRTLTVDLDIHNV